jgi:hypothetical protein
LKNGRKIEKKCGKAKKSTNFGNKSKKKKVGGKKKKKKKKQ